MRTPLYQDCLEAGARIVPFAGWEMPIQFSGHMKEHHAVRKEAGIFDISHMGVLRIQGENPKDALQQLVPSDLGRIGPGEACYTTLLNQQGGIIDDLIIYELNEERRNEQSPLLLIVNAACKEKDIQWIKQNINQDKNELIDAKKGNLLLAIQGPKAQKILEKIFNQSLEHVPRFGHQKINIEGFGSSDNQSLFIANTGYTGENGFEILVQEKAGLQIWQQIIQNGVMPCGLGARDTLRLEAAMNLYGKDMNNETTPFEASLGWLVHLEMPHEFIGRDVLEKQARDGIKKRLVGITLENPRAIARNGYAIFQNNNKVGEITSGSWSPTLQKPIALGYLPNELSKVGTTLEIEIRGTNHDATVVKRPFYRRN